MSLRVEKNENDNPQKLVKKFLTKLKRTGILKTARKKMFYQKPKSDRVKKQEALRREEILRQQKMLEKLGKIEPPVNPPAEISS
jgi:ribosomal protein S21